MMRPRVIVLMGTSGCGKTTVGKALAEKLGGRFVDADEFHPPENLAKMAAGVPLEDTDRWPWLDRLRKEVVDTAGDPVTVLACSALKRSYRRRLGADAPDVALVHLAGTRQLLLDRMERRSGHFMRAEMLNSQLTALDEPTAAEGLTVSIHAPVPEIVAAIERGLRIGSAVTIRPSQEG